MSNTKSQLAKLQIKNIYASIKDGREILHGVSLTINKGEIHALMGPNGSGKSTLAQILMGHPGYVITKGKVILNGEDITKLTPDKRAKLGLFLGFQYPLEVSGVNFGNFLRMALNEKVSDTGKRVSPIAFRERMKQYATELSLPHDIALRSLNEGFSGGEKKKAEILPLTTLRPDYAILDEPDSGLDVDALKYIAKTIKKLDYPFGMMLITHYQRILDYIKPDFVHILVNGKIVRSGGTSVVQDIEKEGYERYLN